MQQVSLIAPEDWALLLAEVRAIRAQLEAAARPTDDYLTLADVATLTRTSQATVRKWIARGKPDQRGHLIKLYTVEFSPGFLRVPRSALVAYGQGLAFNPARLDPLPAGVRTKGA